MRREEDLTDFGYGTASFLKQLTDKFLFLNRGLRIASVLNRRLPRTSRFTTM
jgi:hypothetical protein